MAVGCGHEKRKTREKHAGAQDERRAPAHTQPLLAHSRTRHLKQSPRAHQQQSRFQKASVCYHRRVITANPAEKKEQRPFSSPHLLFLPLLPFTPSVFVEDAMLKHSNDNKKKKKTEQKTHKHAHPSPLPCKWFEVPPQGLAVVYLLVSINALPSPPPPPTP